MFLGLGSRRLSPHCTGPVFLCGLLKFKGAPWRSCVNIIFHCFRVYSLFVLTPPLDIALICYSKMSFDWRDQLRWGVIWLMWPATVGCHLDSNEAVQHFLLLGPFPVSIFYPLDCKDKWLLVELQKDDSFVYCVWKRILVTFNTYSNIYFFLQWNGLFQVR